MFSVRLAPARLLTSGRRFCFTTLSPNRTLYHATCVRAVYLPSTYIVCSTRSTRTYMIHTSTNVRKTLPNAIVQLSSFIDYTQSIIQTMCEEVQVQVQAIGYRLQAIGTPIDRQVSLLVTIHSSTRTFSRQVLVTQINLLRVGTYLYYVLHIILYVICSMYYQQVVGGTQVGT